MEGSLLVREVFSLILNAKMRNNVFELLVKFIFYRTTGKDQSVISSAQ